MIRLVYQFTRPELDALQRMADERQSSKDARGVYDGRMVEDGAGAHLLGLCGEYAVAKLTAGTLDSTSRLDGDNGAPDVTLPNGETVNVKTRSRANWDFLLTPGHHALNADYGVLCWQLSKATPEYPLSIEIAGVVSATDFDDFSEQFDYAHGARLGIRYHLMRRVFLPWRTA